MRTSVGSAAASVTPKSKFTRWNSSRWLSELSIRNSWPDRAATLASTAALRAEGSPLTSRKSTKLVAPASNKVASLAPSTCNRSPSLETVPSVRTSSRASNRIAPPSICPCSRSPSLPVVLTCAGWEVRKLTANAKLPVPSAARLTAITCLGKLAKTSCECRTPAAENSTRATAFSMSRERR